MILTEIGEIGITAGDQPYKLRPSLYAMTQLGEPEEIVRVYASVMADDPHPDQMSDALAVIYACAEGDVSGLFGSTVLSDGKPTYEPGAAPTEHLVPLARCLMKHGVTGALPELQRRTDDEPEYVAEFDARLHASLAIAHLGMSSAEAWQMTMTELVGALRAKFPVEQSDAPGARAPTADEHDRAMAWLDQVEAARAKKQGKH